MAIANDRMDKIAESLNPRQAVIVWMRELHDKFKSVSEYALWLTDQAEYDTDLDMLIKQAEASARNRTHGEPADKAQKKIREAVRDTVFLYCLHSRINEHFYLQSDSLRLMGLLLLEGARNAPQQANPVQPIEDQANNWGGDPKLLRSGNIRSQSGD